MALADYIILIRGGGGVSFEEIAYPCWCDGGKEADTIAGDEGGESMKIRKRKTDRKDIQVDIAQGQQQGTKKKKLSKKQMKIIGIVLLVLLVIGAVTSPNTATNMNTYTEMSKEKAEKQGEQEKQRKQEEEKAAAINSIDSKTVEEAQQIIAPYQSKTTYSKYGDTSNFETEDVTNSFGSPINDLIVVKHDYNQYDNTVKMYILSRSDNDRRLQEERLEKTYSKSDAIADLQTYGESNFYKFDLGIIQMADASQTTTFVNETTWHVKSKCTITNLYGIEVAHNIEADVHTDHTVDNVQVY